MKQFPKNREAKRRQLLDAVESVRDVIVAGADESERIGTLAPSVVEALSDAGLFALKLPAELGGAEADPMLQLEVIEAVAHIDTSAGWAVMIGATSIGWPGAFLPQAGIDIVFKGGRIPTAAGSGGIGGTAERVEGGYKVTGRYAFASGARHAEWLIGGAPVVNGNEGEIIMFVVPVADATVHLDSWDVTGLRGSGSCDFSVNDCFLPSEYTWDRSKLIQGTPERGGPIFRLGMPAFTANEHPGFALGGARRALDLIMELAMTKKRGAGPAASLIADRPVFQRFVGESDQRLKAAQAQVLQLFERAWQIACDGEVPDARLQAEIRVAGVMATEIACDVANQAFRFAGGSALHSTNLLQRFWRDVNASAQHHAVSNAAYEAFGQLLLGIAPEAAASVAEGHARG
jgi:alkylation response protein AidB-like acyl-CoA dehydrogenase